MFGDGAFADDHPFVAFDAYDCRGYYCSGVTCVENQMQAFAQAALSIAAALVQAGEPERLALVPVIGPPTASIMSRGHFRMRPA